MNLQQIIEKIVTRVPSGARIVEANGYRDDDFGPDRIGVQMEFSTGHLEMLTATAPPDACPDRVATFVAARVMLALAVRRAVEVCNV